MSNDKYEITNKYKQYKVIEFSDCDDNMVTDNIDIWDNSIIL